MTNIITITTATRKALKAIATNPRCVARIEKPDFKVLYAAHSNYGKYWGEDFVNHKNEGCYTTALKFKAVLNLVQNGHLWLNIPTQRAAAMGLDAAGSFVWSNENLSLDEALQLVKASEEEANSIRALWNEIGIKEDGYWYDTDEDQETMYPMPPTNAVVNWLSR